MTSHRVRLALGLEVVDAVRGDPADVEVGWENVALPHALPAAQGPAASSPGYDPGLDLPQVPRGSRGGRFRLAFTDAYTPAPPALLRIIDSQRRYVPRRLAIPFATLAAVLAEEQQPMLPVPRGRSVSVYPGAAFVTEGASTGIRGRVVDAAGLVVRWVRAEARHAARGTLLGVGHGDDRGEFLLLLRNPPSSLDAPSGFRFDVRVTVRAVARGTPPPLPLTADPLADPLGDLVREQLPDLGGPDTISAGEVAPASFTRSASTSVACVVGRLISPPDPVVLP